MRRRLLNKKIESDSDYVTSIDGERIKILQVAPKDYDTDGKSIHDEIFEENGKRYLKKQVLEGITGVINPTPLNVIMVPKIRWMGITSAGPIHKDYWNNMPVWIDGVEVCGWGASSLYFNTEGIGINFYRAMTDSFRKVNPNNFSDAEMQEMLSNKSFRYVVPEEEIQIIEII